MDFCFSDDFLKALEFSRDEALRTGWHHIGVEHVMLGILRQGNNEACRALEDSGVSLTELKYHLDKAVFVGEEQISWADREHIHLCESACSMMQKAALEMMRCRASELSPLHFLMAVSRNPGSYSSTILSEMGVSLTKLLEASVGREHYGLMQERPAPAGDDDPVVMPDQTGYLSAIASALEERLRQGYATNDLES